MQNLQYSKKKANKSNKVKKAKITERSVSAEPPTKYSAITAVKSIPASDPMVPKVP
jgi:hypothetical protein